ncbi:MAG: sigma-70 family RNA polymerase sigma factor [Pirellula sp.]|jgi:RNA polymerase sigma factor (sigma-70 family)|nr:sigma-70 family RNA polymerase sigma factor [Pirellula sp.]
MVSALIEVTNNCEVESDKALLLRFQYGDELAFSQIVQRHGLMVRAVCYRILRNSSDCDDAFQATFFILASRAKAVNWQDSVGGWLHQVARRVSLKLKSELTRRRRLELNAAKEEHDQCVGPDQSVSIHELGQILDLEIGRLPSSFREVILLTQSEGLSRAEAATRLGISVAAVKDRLERGRELLQKRLLKRGLSLSAVALAAWLVPNSTSAANVSALVAKTSQLAVVFATGKLMGAPFSAAASLANGTLKILGMQKLAMALTLFLSLVTGGSFLYGFLQDNPTRFESGLRGTIVHIDNDENPSITLELDEYRTLLNLDLSNNAKVWIAYEETSREKLKVGQFIAVKLDVDHRTVKEIHGQGIVREVTIKSVSNPTGLMIEGDDDDPESIPEMIKLAPETILRIGGMNASLNELKPGMTIPLEFGSEGDAVHAIEAEAEASQILEGELLAIDLSKGELILSTETEDDSIVDRRLKIEPSIVARSMEKVIPLEDLRKGCCLRIRLDDDGQTIKGMNVEFPEADDF